MRRTMKTQHQIFMEVKEAVERHDKALEALEQGKKIKAVDPIMEILKEQAEDSRRRMNETLNKQMIPVTWRA